MSTRIPEDADPFLRALITSLDADPRVLGLVLAGSSAERSRRDRWSDHDFLVITEDGTPESYRSDVSWLPDADDIAFWFRDTPHGLKALYRSGLLVEFAVFDRAEFASCALSHFEVVIDRGGVTAAAEAIHGRSMAVAPPDRLVTFRSFLALVYVGTGRARRGERLSANVFLRDFATAHVLRLALDLDGRPDTSASPADQLDPWRRFEQVWPALAEVLDAALARPVVEVGPALLDAVDPFLRERWPAYPADDLRVVRDFLDGG